MEKLVKYKSDDVELAATLFTKDGKSAGKMPGLVLGHGFAGALYPKMATHLANLGYGVLSIEFRGYGRSGGERGRVVPADQINDWFGSGESFSHLAQDCLSSQGANPRTAVKLVRIP